MVNASRSSTDDPAVPLDPRVVRTVKRVAVVVAALLLVVGAWFLYRAIQAGKRDDR